MASTIIVGSDGSDRAIGAASDGLALLRPAGKVIVATVVDAVDLMLAHDASGFAGPIVTEGELEQERRGLLTSGQAVVQRTASALAGLGADVETQVLEGRPGAELCRLATDVSASAIIVGSRGLGGVKRAVLGSVSDFIVRNAPCAVVVVREPGDTEDP